MDNGAFSAGAVDTNVGGITSNTMPLFSFKVTAEEARQIRAKARAAREPSVSSYLRKSALGSNAPAAVVVRQKHPVSGLPYNAGESRVATDAEIRAALADFP
jgi:hypothetical protein